MSISENVTGFQHLGVPVSNIEKSIEFYSRIGFKVLSRYELQEDGGTTYVAFIDLKNFCIEIYQPAAGFDPGRGETGPVDHFALNVADVDQAFEQIKSLGFEPMSDAPVQLPLQKNGIRFFIIQGPDGEKVEFNQML